ncbi:MAG: redoxin domain-containing protein [Muribaculaceae bacterium]|nr:redoxin domain-containing protein [Muribaculaceae bacterium]
MSLNFFNKRFGLSAVTVVIRINTVNMKSIGMILAGGAMLVAATAAPAIAEVRPNAGNSAGGYVTELRVPAPEFTLKDLQGKDVSLSQYRGKWVVLDFWGSWCIWCIKGFPELKENYAKYAGKLEVIGIDCGDTPGAWQDAVRKYDLPWVNLYNPMESVGVDRIYGVQGFPTKVIVTPEGYIADITVGEDPAFYTKLDALMNAD